MKFRHLLAVTAIPAVFVWINLTYLSVLFPVFSAPPGFDQDPAYAYLFNGLLIIDGQRPWQVDHPGTPLQVLSAGVVLVARAMFALAGRPMNPGIIDDVLADPEPYLYVLSCVLMVLNGGALIYLGRRVMRATGSWVLACLCQISGLAFSLVTPKAAYVSPEALLIFATLCLLGQLAPLVFAADQGDDSSAGNGDRGHCSPAWTGIICGLGLALKASFLPLFGMVLLFRPARKLWTVAGYSIVTLMVLLLPTIGNYKRFFQWIWNIASHSGMHGSGQAAVFDVSNALGNLGTVLRWFPGFYLVAAALLAYIVFAFFRNRRSREVNPSLPLRFPLVVFLVVTVQTLLVLKHPGAHYMVPVLPLAFVGLAWLLFQFDLHWCPSATSRAPRLYPLVVMTALAYGLYAVVPTIRQIDRMRVQRLAQDEALAVIVARTQQYPDALVVCAFRCTMPQYATAFGLIYAPGLSTRPIARDLLANFYEYNFLVREFLAPGLGALTLEEMSRALAQSRKVLLVTPKDYPDLAVFDLRKVVSTAPLTLYEVTGIRSGNPG